MAGYEADYPAIVDNLSIFSVNFAILSIDNRCDLVYNSRKRGPVLKFSVHANQTHRPPKFYEISVCGQIFLRLIDEKEGNDRDEKYTCNTAFALGQRMVYAV